jgi:hypothetical protein
VAEILILILSLECGVNQFLGSLQKEIETAPYFAAEFEYDILYFQGAYSYLKLKKNEDFKGLHQYIGRAGIKTPEHLLGPAAIGFGVSIAGVRGRDATPQAENYMLSSSESEFGWHVRLEWSILRFEKFKVGTRLYYDEIWTKPKNSSLMQGGVFVSYMLVP